MRAIARGDLTPDADVAALAEWLVGRMHYRVVVTGEPVDETFIDEVVEGAVSMCRRWSMP